MTPDPPPPNRPNRKQAQREATRLAAVKKRRTRLFAAVVVVTAGSVGVGILIATRSEPTQTVETRAAPDFELPSLNGQTIRLSDYRGQPVAVTFMHTY